VLNIISGYGPTAGAALVGNPDVDKVRSVNNVLHDGWGSNCWHVSGYGRMAGAALVGNPDVDKVRGVR
jgi:acyl-CoA reductase-like NAD-dependent aldehyde dehydrogenase